MARRLDVRIAVVQTLYAYDMGNDEILKFSDKIFEQRRIKNEKMDFGKQLLYGTLNNLEEIDKIITKIIPKSWSFDRLGKIERAILRLGVFEILFYNTDKPLAINEMVEVAKILGDYNTPKFINGILNNVKKQ